MKTRPWIVGLCAVLLGAALLVPLALDNRVWPTKARDWLFAHAQSQAGADNIVSAIYLGYRAFDTLGETLVLLVAISGTLALIQPSAHGPAMADAAAPGVAASPGRTRLLDAFSGKLGPVILIFGVYVMLFGHRSPGGGFQGGAVLASGIILLAMAQARDRGFVLTRPHTLHYLEGMAFAAFMALALVSWAMGSGMLTNPATAAGIPAEASIVLLNAVIGLKVGTALALLCMTMLKETP